MLEFLVGAVLGLVLGGVFGVLFGRKNPSKAALLAAGAKKLEEAAKSKL